MAARVVFPDPGWAVISVNGISVVASRNASSTAASDTTADPGLGATSFVRGIHDSAGGRTSGTTP